MLEGELKSVLKELRKADDDVVALARRVKSALDTQK